MRRFGVAVLLFVWLINFAPSADANVCGKDPFGRPIPCPTADSGGVGYFYDSETRTFYPTAWDEGGREAEPGGPVWLTKYVIVCSENDPDDPAAAMCLDAVCEKSGELGYNVQVYRRLAASDPWEPWPGRARECRLFGPGADPIPLEDVVAEITAVIEEHYAAIASPEIAVAPSANAVVNLPVLASTPDAGTVGFDIENPLPAQVEASPTYTWQWSNGAVSVGAGREYDGVNPALAPDHYPVRTTYISSGTQSVSLTATWTIVLTVGGIPPITDIEPLVYEVSASFPVRSAETVLVDGQ